ncbi:hypothetical protein D9758_010674 [Tetrapyrgos nigripes]|uniref:Uncharacterized protein n=1 Tax=Tetrapyrgos nigripes TaxID=182062 RepID=A0A8H5GG90_9AGAR|nr:hypothetical protein D9758_010674 [Tetrapyrgos nigripes]
MTIGDFSAQALISNGEMKVGVIGCPNLPLNGEGKKGVDAEAPKPTRVHISAGSPSTSFIFPSSSFTFLEFVESVHSSHSTASRIADTLRTTSFQVNNPIRMDSQVKYCVLARRVCYSQFPSSSSNPPNQNQNTSLVLLYLRSQSLA